MIPTDRIDHIESRVEKLEDGQKALLVLPAQLEMLIELQREANKDTKELASHITEAYASKELCTEKHKSISESIAELKDFKKYVYGSLITGAAVIILELLKYLGGK